MKARGLYPRLPLAAIESVAPLEVDPSCKRCQFHEDARAPCIAPDAFEWREGIAAAVAAGELTPKLKHGPADAGYYQMLTQLPSKQKGGLLIVGEGPGHQEDSWVSPDGAIKGRPFVGASGRLIRAAVRQHWGDGVAYANAMGCRPNADIKDKHVKACAPYLAGTIREMQPDRIVALGGWAAYSIFGRAIAPFSNRRAYAYLFQSRDEEDPPIPVFFVLHPAAGLRNRFVGQWFAEDIEWALTAPPPPLPPLGGLWKSVDASNVAQAVDELTRAPWSAFDVETCGVMYEPSFRLLVVGACAKGSSSAWSWGQEALADPACLDGLRAWLEDPGAKKCGSNVKFDSTAMRLTMGIKPRGVSFDARIWRKLLEPEASGYLEDMVELVGMGGMKEEAGDAMAPLVEKVKLALSTHAMREKRAEQPEKRWPALSQKRLEAERYFAALEERDPVLASVAREDPSEWARYGYGLISDEVRDRYNARDAVSTAHVAEWLEPQFSKHPVDVVRRAFVDRVSVGIARVEEWGIAVDRGALELFDRRISSELVPLRERIRTEAPELDPDSSTSVRNYLYGKLGLKATKKTKKAEVDSTDHEALQAIEGKHPLVKMIINWRKLTKLKGTYACGHKGKRGLLQHVRSDGRVHSSFLIDGARTGRSSSSDPNLQNIVSEKRDPLWGKLARDCFVASPGHVLVSLDHSQVELRFAAIISGDPEMIEIFRSGIDFHLRTAQLISRIAWNIAPEDVKKEHRAVAKNVNFAILYAAGIDKIASMIGGTKIEAATVQSAVLSRFKKFASWANERRLEAERYGYVHSWWDHQPARRRPLWRIADKDSYVASNARNSSCNSPIQASASDVLLAGLADCIDWIETEKLDENRDVMIVAPVHDQLLFDVREDLAPMVVETARRIMTSVPSGDVPLVVDAEWGKAWGSLEAWKEAA